MERYSGPYLYLPVGRGRTVQPPLRYALTHAVRTLTAQHGRPPSRRELMALFGWRSATACEDALVLAAKHGLLRIDRGKHRGIVAVQY